MLLKTKCLTNLSVVHRDMSSEVILDEYYWKGRGNIFSLIPRDQFVQCAWSDFTTTIYAVLSYQWRTNWHSTLKFIFDPANGVKAEYIWIDIFCLNQLVDGNRMRTIAMMDEIYYHC